MHTAMVGFCQHNRLPGNRTGYRRNYNNNVNIGLPFEVEARPSIEALKGMSQWEIHPRRSTLPLNTQCPSLFCEKLTINLG